MGTQKKGKQVRRFLSEEQVIEVAQGLIQSKYFMSDQLPEHMQDKLHLVFLPLVFMEKRDLKNLAKYDIVCIYEENSLAMPRGINGFPMFPSCRMLTREDYKAVISVEKSLRDAMKGALEPKKEGKGEPRRLQKVPRRGGSKQGRTGRSVSR